LGGTVPRLLPVAWAWSVLSSPSAQLSYPLSDDKDVRFLPSVRFVLLFHELPRKYLNNNSILDVDVTSHISISATECQAAPSAAAAPFGDGDMESMTFSGLAALG